MSLQARRPRGTLGKRRKRVRSNPVLAAQARLAAAVVPDPEAPCEAPAVLLPPAPKEAVPEIRAGSKKEDGYDPVVLWVPPEAGGRGVWDEGAGAARACGKTPEAPEGSVVVDACLGRFLRPHQRAGVRFLWDCLTGVRVTATARELMAEARAKPQGEAGEGEGPGRAEAASSSSSAAAGSASSLASPTPDARAPMEGAILADDMGLGKTLQSVAILWTCLTQGPGPDPLARRAIVVTPTSLVANWSKEIVKWLGARCPHVALSEADRPSVLRGIASFLSPRGPRVLILSYEAFRAHALAITGPGAPRDACELLICDEAHRLKNNDTQTSRALASLPTRRRILLSGTPIQNNLDEFFAMADFANPGVLGSVKQFRRAFGAPILEAREPGAPARAVARAAAASGVLSSAVNQFVLRRTNALLSDHLPPKRTQIVACPLTPLQRRMYEAVLASDRVRGVVDEGEDDGGPARPRGVLPVIAMLRKICNHPLLAMQPPGGDAGSAGVTEELQAAMLASARVPDSLVAAAEGRGASRRRGGGVDMALGGKLALLAAMLDRLRAGGEERIVVVSVFTQTLDLVGQLCSERRMPSIRLDGSVSAGKRQRLVDRFNDPSRDEFAFLLSSRAGGCGLNLVGASRLVMLDFDWNPATDAQAAARVWRDGQRRRVFVYRFMATGTLEETILQRQLSKEGLRSVVEAGRRDATLSSEALRDLFVLRGGVESATHRAMHCPRCFGEPDVPVGESQEWDPDANEWRSDEEEGEEEEEEDEDEEGGKSRRRAGRRGPRVPTPKRCLALSRRQLGQPEETDLNRWAHHRDVESIRRHDPLLADAASPAEEGSDPLLTFAFVLHTPGKKLEADPDPAPKRARLGVRRRRPGRKRLVLSAKLPTVRAVPRPAAPTVLAEPQPEAVAPGGAAERPAQAAEAAPAAAPRPTPPTQPGSSAAATAIPGSAGKAPAVTSEAGSRRVPLSSRPANLGANAPSTKADDARPAPTASKA